MWLHPPPIVLGASIAGTKPGAGGRPGADNGKCQYRTRVKKIAAAIMKLYMTRKWHQMQ